MYLVLTDAVSFQSLIIKIRKIGVLSESEFPELENFQNLFQQKGFC